MKSSICLNARSLSGKLRGSLWQLLIVGLSVSILRPALAQEISWTPRTITFVQRHYTLVFSPDSKTLLTHSTDGKFRFWATRTGALLQTVHATSQKRTLTAIAPDGKALCRMVREPSITAAELGRRAYQLSDIPSLLLKWDRAVIMGEEGIAVSRDRRLLAISKSVWSGLEPRSGSNPNVGIELWNVSRGQLIRTLKPEPSKEYGSTPMGSSRPVFSFDNKILATVMTFAYLYRHSAESPGGYLEFQLWDTQTGRQSPIGEKIRSQKPTGGPLTSSPVAPLLAFEADEEVCLADMKTGTIQLLEGHTGQITALAFSPDGSQLASGSADSTVRLWDVKSGKTVRIIRGHENGIDSGDLTFAPDGNTLASSDGSTIKLWRIK